MSLIETGLGQETRFYSPDIITGGAGLSGAGQCCNVCIVKLSHFRGSLHEFHQKSYRVNPSLRQRCVSHLASKGIALVDAGISIGAFLAEAQGHLA